MSKMIELIETHIPLIKLKICQKIDSFDLENRSLDVTFKNDKTPFTQIDQYISELFKEFIVTHFPEMSFYSEESMDSTVFPVCILDPIDGTRELIANNGECAVSFGFYYSKELLDERNFSWIFNPFTGFEISSNNIFSSGAQRTPLAKPMCYVSRSEYKDGLFNDKLSTLNISPLGSIALKLAHLSAGSCDVVISLRDKNIWDIAAGMHIFLKRGGKAFESGEKINTLDFKLYKSPLVFTYSEIIQDVLSQLKS